MPDYEKLSSTPTSATFLKARLVEAPSNMALNAGVAWVSMPHKLEKRFPKTFNREYRRKYLREYRHKRFFHTPWECLPPVEDPVYLAEKLLPAGALCILYAPSGLGKTVVALTLAKAIANGQTFHERETTQGNVLYIDYEMGEAQLRRYGNRLGLRGPIQPCHDVPLLELVTLIKEAIADGCRLVILDSYASLANQTGNDNAVNSNSVAETILKPLADLAHNTGVTILVLHHTNKSNFQYDGSQRIKGLADVMFKLTLNKRQKRMHLHVEKNRFGAEALDWDAADHPSIQGRAEDDQDFELEEDRFGWIADQLNAGSRTADEPANEYHMAFGKSRKSLERDLAEALEAGAITREKLGRSFSYSLAVVPHAA